MIKFNRSLPTACLLILTVLISGILVLPSVTFASEYTHNSPAFSVTFPDNWNIMPSIYKNQILYVQEPGPGTRPQLHISVGDLPEGANLANAGKRYAEGLKLFSKEITIISDEEIKLENGTPARKSVLKWNWGGVAPLNSLVVTAIRNNKEISIEIHAPGELGEVENNIASSLWVAGEKTFVNKEPSFSVTYPDNYKHAGFVNENQVLRARGGLGTIESTITDLLENQKLEDSGKAYENAMKVLPVASDVKLYSSEQIKLKDGTPAARNVLEWKWNTLPMKTLSLTTFKDNKSITLSVHSWYMGFKDWGTDYEAEANGILNSMSLK